MLGGDGVDSRVKGQAVILQGDDKDEKDLLLVLLTGPPSNVYGGFSANPADLVVHQFELAQSIGSLNTDTIKSLSSIESKSELSASEMPFVLHLPDANSPASARQAHLDSGERRGEAHLIRAAIETTHDLITTGIENYIPWTPNFDSAVTARRAMAEGGPILDVTDSRSLFYR
jgi:hypothetical protein